MRVNICSCLLAFVLGCNVTAAINHEVLEEKNPVTLRCPHSVEGQVTWSRESSGSNVDILTADGDRDIKHIHDPFRRYSALADKSLHISRVTVSDTGRYLCNNKPAVELTVIPSGTSRLTAPERTSITLTCPPDVGGSGVPTWTRDFGEIQLQWFHVSPVDKTLTITYVQPGDSGLYHCDGKAAAYLTVTKGDQSETEGKKTSGTSRTTRTTTTPPPPTTRTTPTPTTTTLTLEASTAPKNQQPPLDLVFGIVGPFLLLLLIIIIIYFTWRRRFKTRGSEEKHAVYEEIQDGLVFQPTNGLGSSAGPPTTYCMRDFPDGSNQNDHTYSTIPDLPRVGDENPYSLIDNTFLGGNNNGPTQLGDNTYFLVEKPKAPGKSND